MSKTLRAGCVALSLWSGLNLLLAIGIFTALASGRANAPALHILFAPSEIAAIEPRALATINALAALGNGCIVGLCALLLVVTWAAVARGVRWAFIGVTGVMSFVQLAGFVSDAFLEHRDLVPNLVSTGVLAAGVVLVAIERKRERE